MTTTRAKDPKIVGESQRVLGIVKNVFIGLLILFLVLAVVRWGQKKAKEAETAAKQQQAAATAQPAPPQQWQLCWEKVPGAAGTTSTQSLCLPATIKRDSQSLVLVYNEGKGTMEASSTDNGTTYTGLWKDTGGWGRFYVHFSSPTSAVGWTDEKGDKPINLWLVAK